MRWLLWLVASLLFGLGIQPWDPVAWGADAKVSIKGQVVVKGREILLSEISVVSGASDELLRQLQTVSLGPSPRPGEFFTFSRGTLLTRLRSYVPDAGRIQWLIADQVTVRRAARQVERDEVVQALKTWLEGHQSLPVEQLRVEQVQLKTPIRVPEGALELDFEPLAGDDLLGPTTLTLVARVDGEQVLRMPVQARVDGELSVLVTARAIRMGQVLSDADLTEERRLVSTVGARPALNRSEVVGFLATRALGPNRVLGLDDVVAPPRVRKGEPVTILVRTEHLLLTCAGEAREDGRVGQFISVTNLQSRKEVRGRVTEQGDVMIEYRPPSSLLQSRTP